MITGSPWSSQAYEKRLMTTTSKIKTVWILQTGEPVFGDEDSTRPMRALSLAAFLNRKVLRFADHKSLLSSAERNANWKFLPKA